MCGSKSTPIWSLLLIVVCAVSISTAQTESTPNPDHDITILSPTDFYVGQPNRIVVRSRQSICKLTILTRHEGVREFSFTIDPQPISPSSSGWYQYDLNYQIPYQSEEMPNLQVQVNFLVRKCEPGSVNLVNLTEVKTIIASSALLLGETDKPIYRPGELVRARFMMFNPNPVPASQKPEYGLSQDDHGNVVLKKSDNKQSDLDNLTSFGYQLDLVTITNPNGDRVKQWLNPTALQAANLTYQLLPDAEPGTWSIQATAGHLTEKLKIKVEKYVLPRFLVSIEPLSQLFTDSKEAPATVCAKYTNGQPMKGIAHVSFCICDTYDPTSDSGTDSTKKLESILETQTCPKTRYTNEVRPCLTKNQPLLPNGCTSLNFTIHDYLPNDRRSGLYFGKSVICVKVEEDGTGSSVSKCEIGNSVQERQRSLKFEFPTVYRPGLPILGRVRFQGDLADLNQTGRTVKIVVEEYNMWCDWHHESTKAKQYLYLTYVELDSQGVAPVLIRPINQIVRLRIQAQMANQKPIRPEPRPSRNPLPMMMMTPLPYPPLVSASDHVMEPWASLDKGVMQIWAEDLVFKPQCPGQLRLKLIANRPLADKMLYLESVVQRKPISVRFQPEATTEHDDCQSRDDHFGHYKCLSPKSDEIECLDGWTGPDCLIPICDPNCNASGGTCSQPGECLCRPGWNGTNCDQCIRRSGCEHGKCVLGDDCVCEPGWRGYHCAQRAVQFERIQTEDDETLTKENESEVISEDRPVSVTEEGPVDSKPKRTIYQREISFQLDSNWGPEANVVLYYMDVSDEGTGIIATGFRIEGMTQCTSEAIATQYESELDGLTIQPQSVDPGSRIQLNIVPHILTENQTVQTGQSDSGLSQSSDMCFVRISDTALDNYDGDSKNLVDFVYYADKLKQYGLANSDHYRQPESNHEAFRLAGLHLSTSYPQVVVRPSIRPCTFAYMTRSGQPGPPPLMRGIVEMADSSMMNMIEKPRLRDFFPEVWLFDLYAIQELPPTSSQVKRKGVQLDLTVPDTITTWRASSFCTTQNRGLFIVKPQTLLVSMPFFIDLTIPKEAKRGEILHLPLSLFVYDRPNSDQSGRSHCYEVSMTVDLDPQDWLRIGADKYTGCVCTGEKQTFIMSLMPQRLGHLNVTAEAYAMPDSPMCSQTGTAPDSTKPKPLADRIRRSVEVVPEGIAAETSVGDILCLGESQLKAEQKFPLNLPSNIVPGSLRTYISYSDEVLGPALVNLDNLVRLPTGCGEQNMVLVAPNVFVLDYVLSTSQSNTTKYKSLIRKARTHIEKGYHQQLKYRRTDGSFSAWGDSDASGSTWLTAFVLRVFHKATQLGLDFPFDNKLLFDDTIRYLLEQQDPLTGCFMEKGRVIHEGMQGSVGKKGSHILLTTYVSAALWPILPKNESLAKWRNKSLERVFKDCLKTTESVDWSNVSTPVLVQYAHNMVLMHLDSDLSTKLVELVRARGQTTEGDSMHKMDWARQTNPSDQSSYQALDIETTSYAYLTLAKAGLTSSELLPIVRWLSSQQKAQGGFHSTQDTVLGLEVIADFAKRLGLSQMAKHPSDLNVSFAIEPLGYAKTDLFGLEQRGYLNRQQIPIDDPKQVALSSWSLTSQQTSVRECLAVQIALLYNLPDPTKNDQARFDVTSSVIQSMTQPDQKSCTKASMLICVRPKLDLPSSASELETGMLLISVTMVTGWTPSEDLVSSHMNSSSIEAVKRIEIGDNGQVSIYFDGFSQTESDQVGGWANVKRCVTLSMHQTVYIEDAKPGIITVRDYYMSERMIETAYLLDECREAWHVNARPVHQPSRGVTDPSPVDESITTLTPTSECPICQLDTETLTQLADKLYEIRCHISSYLIYVQPTGQNATQINATAFQFYWGGMTANWNTTIDRTSLSQCKCDILNQFEPMLVFSPSRLNIYAGDPSISFLQSANRRPCCLVSSEDKSVFVLSARQIVTMIEPLMVQWNQKNETQCKHFETVVNYVKRKIMP